MSAAVILFVFLVAFVVTVLKGPGWALAAVYLPTLIMLNQLPGIPIAHLPLQPEFAPILGILFGAPFSNEPIRFKWNSVDLIVLLCLVSAVITSLNNGVVETGINMLRNEFLRWVGPYYIARSAFRSTDIRRFCLQMLVGLLGVIVVLAMIEFRLVPYFYLHVLQTLGMGNGIHDMAYGRYGFFRVSGPAEHPIYFGNMCVVLLGMVAVLATTTGTSLKNPWVIAAMLAAFACVIMSISFTPLTGMIGGTCFLLTLVAVPATRKLVTPLVLVVIVGMFAFTYRTAHEPLGEKKEGDLNGSYYTRKVIITESWKKAVTAGAFGYGPEIPADSDFDLASVDNSYMLFTMTRGYVYTTLWILIGVAFSVRTTRAFLHVRHRSQLFPIAGGAATIFALMLSMYTVWGGAIYVVVWAVMLGLSNTLIDLVIYPQMLTDTALKRRGRTIPMIAGRPEQGALSGLQMAQVGGPIGRK